MAHRARTCGGSIRVAIPSPFDSAVSCSDTFAVVADERACTTWSISWSNTRRAYAPGASHHSCRTMGGRAGLGEGVSAQQACRWVVAWPAHVLCNGHTGTAAACTADAVFWLPEGSSRLKNSRTNSKSSNQQARPKIDTHDSMYTRHNHVALQSATQCVCAPDTQTMNTTSIKNTKTRTSLTWGTPPLCSASSCPQWALG